MSLSLFRVVMNRRHGSGYNASSVTYNFLLCRLTANGDYRGAWQIVETMHTNGVDRLGTFWKLYIFCFFRRLGGGFRMNISVKHVLVIRSYMGAFSSFHVLRDKFRVNSNLEVNIYYTSKHSVQFRTCMFRSKHHAIRKQTSENGQQS